MYYDIVTISINSKLKIIYFEFDVIVEHMWPLRKQMQEAFEKLRSGVCKTIL